MRDRIKPPQPEMRENNSHNDPESPSPVDFLLSWKESIDQAEEKDRDEIVLTGEEMASPRNVEAKGEAGERYSSPMQGDPSRAGADSIQLEEQAAPMTSDEIFQWTEERNREIEEALGSASTVQVPVIHGQIDRLRAALEEGLTPDSRAEAILDEADRYLQKQVKSWSGRIPIAHEAVIAARSLIIDALGIYQESAGLLRQYLSSRDRTHLELSRRLADQGASFLISARIQLEGARVEPPQRDEGEG